MNISVTRAAEEWGVSRTTIYQKINDGELSRTSDKKIDTVEMLRVFGEPVFKKRTEHLVNTTHSTHSNSQDVQNCTAIEHQLALEKLTNEHLRQQVNDQKQLIENYQQQLTQLHRTLEKANASIHDFAQTRLLEFKKSEAEYETLPEPNAQTIETPAVKKKKKWWEF